MYGLAFLAVKICINGCHEDIFCCFASGCSVCLTNYAVQFACYSNQATEYVNYSMTKT